MGRIEPGRPTGAGIGGGRPALGLLVLLTLVVGGCRGAEAPECPPGAAGCQCTEPFAARGCAPGLVCLVGLCLGGEVPVPDGYLFTAEALDDEDRIDGILKDRIDLAPGMVVVDIGAGDGFFTRHAARRVSPGGRVWATDIDPAALESIRESIEAAPDRAVLDAAITQRLARTPWDTALEDLPDGSADLVAMFRVFTFQIADHAKNLDYLREIARKVRPGGAPRLPHRLGQLQPLSSLPRAVDAGSGVHRSAPRDPHAGAHPGDGRDLGLGCRERPRPDGPHVPGLHPGLRAGRSVHRTGTGMTLPRHLFSGTRYPCRMAVRTGEEGRTCGDEWS